VADGRLENSITTSIGMWALYFDRRTSQYSDLLDMRYKKTIARVSVELETNIMGEVAEPWKALVSSMYQCIEPRQSINNNILF
jgi:hypothetical protein